MGVVPWGPKQETFCRALTFTVSTACSLELEAYILHGGSSEIHLHFDTPGFSSSSTMGKIMHIARVWVPLLWTILALVIILVIAVPSKRTSGNVIGLGYLAGVRPRVNLISSRTYKKIDRCLPSHNRDRSREVSGSARLPRLFQAQGLFRLVSCRIL